MKLRYCYELYEMRGPLDMGRPYGLLAKERRDGGWHTVAVAAAFSGDREAVARLAARCTELQLSPVHLIDVVEDFLCAEGAENCVL